MDFKKFILLLQLLLPALPRSKSKYKSIFFLGNKRESPSFIARGRGNHRFYVFSNGGNFFPSSPSCS